MNDKRPILSVKALPPERALEIRLLALAARHKLQRPAKAFERAKARKQSDTVA